MARKILTIRVYILIAFLVFALLAINPNPWKKGIEIKSAPESSDEFNAGIRSGEIIKTINRQQISSIQEFNEIKESLKFEPITVDLETDQGKFTYTTLGDIGFIQSNLTIISVTQDIQLPKGAKIISINSIETNSDESFREAVSKIIPKKSITITTDKSDYAFLLSKPLQITVTEAKKTNINKGLELQGGTRVLLEPISETETTDKQINDLIDVLNNRLNVYGLADLKIRPANDLSGNKFVLIEIAGATREEVKELIGKQGKFEAKIGNETAFTGGKGDIPFVCKDDGSCSGVIPPCQQLAQDQFSCRFQFAISLSEEAANRHAKITENLEINTSTGGDYLSKTLDLHLDDKLVDSLQIGSDLKGRPTTQVAVSGPGFGLTEEAAYENAISQMNKLQTILITGSLPLKLEIVKLDTISPALGQEFTRNSFIVGFFAILSVALVLGFRYRKLKITIPMIITMLSEVFIVLGFAALIQWNLDLAAIAGIIASVGTGVDDQIVITDEVLKGEKLLNWKEKIKRSFFIIFTAYAGTVAAMLPLWNAGAGLLRGFALTTIVGVTIGVFITRPAYASIIEYLLEE